MKEIWKPIEGFEDYYEVSNTGKVRSCTRVMKLKGKREGQVRTYQGKILKPLFSQDHVMVHLQKQGVRKSVGIGKLVAIHFLDGFKESGRSNVQYIDGDPTNCSIDNLK